MTAKLLETRLHVACNVVLTNYDGNGHDDCHSWSRIECRWSAVIVDSPRQCPGLKATPEFGRAACRRHGKYSRNGVDKQLGRKPFYSGSTMNWRCSGSNGRVVES